MKSKVGKLKSILSVTSCAQSLEEGTKKYTQRGLEKNSECTQKTSAKTRTIQAFSKGPLLYSLFLNLLIRRTKYVSWLQRSRSVVPRLGGVIDLWENWWKSLVERKFTQSNTCLWSIMCVTLFNTNSMMLVGKNHFQRQEFVS